MSFVCPVCNGLEVARPICRACGQQAEDVGKLSDYFAPYSPYRPIDDLKSTFADPDNSECIHRCYCTACNTSFVAHIAEWVQ